MPCKTLPQKHTLSHLPCSYLLSKLLITAYNQGGRNFYERSSNTFQVSLELPQIIISWDYLILALKKLILRYDHIV